MEATCPEITIWKAYCADSMSADERLIAESHLVSCGRCRQQLISLFDAAREADVEPAPDFLKRRALRLAPEREKRSLFVLFRPFAPVALAAVIVVAVGVSFFMYRGRTRTSTTDLRRSDPTTAGISLSNPPHGSTLESGAIEFRWEDSTLNARYEFTLTDEKGDIVVQERDAKSPLRPDTGALRLSPQRKYYWSVTAQLPDGTRRESPIASFTIK